MAAFTQRSADHTPVRPCQQKCCFTADIRSQLYTHLEMLSLRFYDKWDIGALMARVSNDSGTLQDFLIRGMPLCLTNVCAFAGICILMFWINWQLALVVLIPLPLVWLFCVYFWRRLGVLYQRWWHAGSRFSAHLGETLAGIRITKAFTREAREIQRFGLYNRALLDANVETSRNRAALVATMTLISGLGVLTVWLVGSWKVLHQQISLGTLLAFYGYIVLFYGPVQWFGQVSTWMTQAFTGAQRIFEILDMQAEDEENSSRAPVAHIRGHVVFESVAFGYDPAIPVLRQIDLDVAPGEFIGLVGRSGAGKTTLINLLCRFYVPDRGLIRVDGIDIRTLRVRDVRSQIGLVLQEPFLFTGSILENIRYGKPDAGVDEIIDAAKAANAHAFILGKPDGYDTEVGERGNRLSGGEKQRIAIARAILRSPRILILDEATSSVDPISERLIQEGIRRLSHNRTTFAIAHRLSTVRNANRLIVLDHGCIVETGTYEELCAQKGLFAEVVKLQQELPEFAALDWEHA